MKDWAFAPSLSKEIGCNLNGTDLQCGWYSRKANSINCIVLVLENWTYISLVDESFKLLHLKRYAREISIDENNKILTESIDK